MAGKPHPALRATLTVPVRDFPTNCPLQGRSQRCVPTLALRDAIAVLLSSLAIRVGSQRAGFRRGRRDHRKHRRTRVSVLVCGDPVTGLIKIVRRSFRAFGAKSHLRGNDLALCNFENTHHKHFSTKLDFWISRVANLHEFVFSQVDTLRMSHCVTHKISTCGGDKQKSRHKILFSINSISNFGRCYFSDDETDQNPPLYTRNVELMSPLLVIVRGKNAWGRAGSRSEEIKTSNKRRG